MSGNILSTNEDDYNKTKTEVMNIINKLPIKKTDDICYRDLTNYVETLKIFPEAITLDLIDIYVIPDKNGGVHSSNEKEYLSLYGLVLPRINNYFDGCFSIKTIQLTSYELNLKNYFAYDKYDALFDINVYYCSYAYMEVHGQDNNVCKIEMDRQANEVFTFPDITIKNPLIGITRLSNTDIEYKIKTDGHLITMKCLNFNTIPRGVIGGCNLYAITHFKSKQKTLFVERTNNQSSFLCDTTTE